MKNGGTLLQLNNKTVSLEEIQEGRHHKNNRGESENDNQQPGGVVSNSLGPPEEDQVVTCAWLQTRVSYAT